MITITRTPYKYAPSQNPMIWEFTTDNSNTIYFNVTVYDKNNNIIINNKIYVSPSSNSSFIDLSKIIDNLVTTPINNSENIIENLDGTVEYYLTITGINAQGNVSDTAITTSRYYAFNGMLNNFDLYNDSINSYFMQSGYV